MILQYYIVIRSLYAVHRMKEYKASDEIEAGRYKWEIKLMKIRR